MKLNFKKTMIFSSIALGALVVLNTGCSGSAVGVDNISLSSLPSASGLVAASSSSNSMIVNPAVVGTPPIVSELDADDFYGDLFTRIAGGDNGRACEAERDEFFGMTADGVGGDTACWMSQSVGKAVGQIMQNAASLCYMKNMPSAEGVTITPELAVPTSIFTQQDEDRLVRVNVSNQPSNEDGGEGVREGDFTVFIKVLGAANAGASKYTAQLWFCHSDQVTGLESFTVDAANKTFTSTSVNQEEGGAFSSEVSAGVEIDADGNISFDLDKARTGNVAFDGGAQTFKAFIEVAANNIVTAKNKNSGNFGSDEQFTKAEISGSGISDLRFLQGATRGFSQYGEGEDDNHSYQGAVEWVTDVYRRAAATMILESIDSDYRSDDFYTEEVSVDTSALSGLDCSSTPDYTVTMDFEAPGVKPLAEQCESEHFQFNDLCNSGAVSTNRDNVFSSWPTPDPTCG